MLILLIFRSPICLPQLSCRPDIPIRFFVCQESVVKTETHINNPLILLLHEEHMYSS